MSATDFMTRPPVGRRAVMAGVIVLAVLGAMAVDTTVVRIGSAEDTRVASFDPDSYGTKTFPRIRDYVEQNTVPAPELAKALAADKTAAVAKYGKGATMPVIPVSFTGTVGAGKAGIYDVDVVGAQGVRIRVQTGPAINGTDLRDAPGDIAFGQFKNQIEYQDAGAGINRAMKAAVLEGLETSDLTGKQISIKGVFRLINPKMWLVTPVEVSVK